MWYQQQLSTDIENNWKTGDLPALLLSSAEVTNATVLAESSVSLQFS